MSEIDIDLVLTRLSARQGLTDFTYFVGRRDILRELTGVGAGNNVWIYGVRRVGKSSVARRLQEDSVARGVRSIWVDMSDAHASRFDAMLRRTLRATPFAGDD